jgi:hypothetical protein
LRANWRTQKTNLFGRFQRIVKIFLQHQQTSRQYRLSALHCDTTNFLKIKLETVCRQFALRSLKRRIKSNRTGNLLFQHQWWIFRKPKTLSSG